MPHACAFEGLAQNVLPGVIPGGFDESNGNHDIDLVGTNLRPPRLLAYKSRIGRSFSLMHVLRDAHIEMHVRAMAWT